jgi:Arc/MetJ-type ribon-helix-helix transcriptional regulator
MKVSVSLPERDIAFLDEYAAEQGLESRSAAFHAAIKALRDRDLQDEYAVAIDEWYASGDAEAWDATIADGIEPDASR